MDVQAYVYILASKPYGTLYAGTARDLITRVSQHKSGHGSGFTAKYNVTKLVWFDGFEDLATAIVFERRLKRWRRDWKISLIERDNPNWADLSATLQL